MATDTPSPRPAKRAATRPAPATTPNALRRQLTSLVRKAPLIGPPGQTDLADILDTALPVLLPLRTHERDRVITQYRAPHRAPDRTSRATAVATLQRLAAPYHPR